MERAILIGCFILTQLLCFTSVVISQRSPEIIAKLIQESKPDTSRVSLFLEAAMSYVLRAGSQPSDMDTAREFVSKAFN